MKWLKLSLKHSFKVFNSSWECWSKFKNLNYNLKYLDTLVHSTYYFSIYSFNWTPIYIIYSSIFGAYRNSECCINQGSSYVGYYQVNKIHTKKKQKIITLLLLQGSTNTGHLFDLALESKRPWPSTGLRFVALLSNMAGRRKSAHCHYVKYHLYLYVFNPPQTVTTGLLRWPTIPQYTYLFTGPDLFWYSWMLYFDIAEFRNYLIKLYNNKDLLTPSSV